MESLKSAGSAPAPPTMRPHVVLLASPDAGHLIPLCELTRRLVEHHGFSATLVTFHSLSEQQTLPSSLPASVTIAPLPAVKIDDLPTDALRPTVLVELIRRSLPSLRTLLRSISSTTPIAALVPDLLCSAALPLAAELGVPAYIFFTTNITHLYLVHRLVELHEGASPGEYRALTDPLDIPGGLSLCRTDLPEGYRCSEEPVYARLLAAGRRYRLAHGFLANSFNEMEPAAVEAFRQVAELGAFPPVFPVGPLVRSESDEEAAAGAWPLLEWLDGQPARSVVFVSFGSGGALSVEQTAELAAGLEASGHRFLWVLRMPSLDGRSHAFGPGADDDDPLAWHPEGFVQRTEGRGLAVAAWAPQVRVLSHPATAAFVSHCGWNSTLESAVAGVPVIAWPLHTEQRMNALLLEESLGVALRPRAREEGCVMAREEVAAAVKELMEGENGHAVRRRAEELQQAAARALSPEGSSSQALEDVAAKWKAALSHGP
ncbi:hypothetical protein ACQ4PT_040921 [Festuca glaucescens]